MKKGTNQAQHGRCPKCGGRMSVDGICYDCGFDECANGLMQQPDEKPAQRQVPNMNLARCADCGQLVSIHAARCPHCGCEFESDEPEEEERPKRSNGGVFWAVVFGILVAVYILSKTMHVEITGTIVPMK